MAGPARHPQQNDRPISGYVPRGFGGRGTRPQEMGQSQSGDPRQTRLHHVSAAGDDKSLTIHAVKRFEGMAQVRWSAKTTRGHGWSPLMAESMISEFAHWHIMFWLESRRGVTTK
jgi:hypothetical protein